MHAFLCNETNFFCVSTTSGLLHDVFQFVSVHPIPIEICYGLLRYARKLTPYLLLSHRRSIRAVMAIVLIAEKPKEPIITTPTATSIAT